MELKSKSAFLLLIGVTLSSIIRSTVNVHGCMELDFLILSIFVSLSFFMLIWENEWLTIGGKEKNEEKKVSFYSGTNYDLIGLINLFYLNLCRLFLERHAMFQKRSTNIS